MTTRLKSGDFFRVETPNGVGYFQYVAHDPKHGALIRVFAGACAGQSMEIEDIQKRPSYFLFYPLEASQRAGLVKKVGYLAIPEPERQIPAMLAFSPRPPDGAAVKWWLWDGQRDQPIQKLSSVDRLRSIRQIVSHPVLVDRIATGWMPSDLIEKLSVPLEGVERRRSSAARPVRHYLYFGTERQARQAAGELEKSDFEVVVRPSADGSQHLVLVNTRAGVGTEIASQRERLEAVARASSGEYDGWEYGG